MTPILLGVRRLDELGLNARLEPRDAERREPAERGGSKGHAVVGADALREAVLTEEPLEDGNRGRICLRSELLPMCPVCAATPPNIAWQLTSELWKQRLRRCILRNSFAAERESSADNTLRRPLAAEVWWTRTSKR